MGLRISLCLMFDADRGLDRVAKAASWLLLLLELLRFASASSLCCCSRI